MSFVTCALKGGLGNQMFQIATAAALGAEHGLDFFLMDGQFCGATTGSNPSKYYSTLYAKIPRKKLIDKGDVLEYEECKFGYVDFNEQVEFCKQNELGLVINGYFQSERYFQKHATYIRSLFTPAEGLDKYIRNNTDLYRDYPELDPRTPDGLKRAFIGVRRGDYCRYATVHNPASMNYYNRAMAAAQADVYYIMSDDIGWCRSQFINEDGGPRYVFFEEPDDLRAFFFARLFQTYICANSTYHWWASYLSLYPTPTVYTPKEHFGPAGPQDYQDYFRSDMILISGI